MNEAGATNLLPGQNQEYVVIINVPGVGRERRAGGVINFSFSLQSDIPFFSFPLDFFPPTDFILLSFTKFFISLFLGRCM